MAETLTIEEFRALERPEQVAELELVQALGVGVFRHHVVNYYMYADYYVGLGSTKCGVDFTWVFTEGEEYTDMMESIALSLPRSVKRLNRAEREEAERLEFRKTYRPCEPFQDLCQRMHNMGLDHHYAEAKEQGLHMEYFRSLPSDQQTYMAMQLPSAGTGKFDHYYALYTRKDDFFLASCTTQNGKDFHIVFRDGRAYADMIRAGAGVDDGGPMLRIVEG